MMADPFEVSSDDDWHIPSSPDSGYRSPITSLLQVAGAAQNQIEGAFGGEPDVAVQAFMDAVPSSSDTSPTLSSASSPSHSRTPSPLPPTPSYSHFFPHGSIPASLQVFPISPIDDSSSDSSSDASSIALPLISGPPSPVSPISTLRDICLGEITNPMSDSTPSPTCSFSTDSTPSSPTSPIRAPKIHYMDMPSPINYFWKDRVEITSNIRSTADGKDLFKILDFTSQSSPSTPYYTDDPQEGSSRSASTLKRVYSRRVSSSDEDICAPKQQRS